MRYQGGKSRIAKDIAAKIRELHPTATEIWEPFCGGGAVTLALAKVGFHVHASDNHEDLILMWQALMRGETEPFADVTEAEYQTAYTRVQEERAGIRIDAPTARRGFVGFGASFGGRWFEGYGRANGKAQPWQESQRSAQKLRGANVTFTLLDYLSTPPDVLVYADPPYVGTKPYSGSPAFDHAAFWSWVRQRKGPTFISELTGPDDIAIVWRKAHKSDNASNSPTTKTTAQIITREERLYYKPGVSP